MQSPWGVLHHLMHSSHQPQNLLRSWGHVWHQCLHCIFPEITKVFISSYHLFPAPQFIKCFLLLLSTDLLLFAESLHHWNASLLPWPSLYIPNNLVCAESVQTLDFMTSTPGIIYTGAWPWTSCLSDNRILQEHNKTISKRLFIITSQDQVGETNTEALLTPKVSPLQLNISPKPEHIEMFWCNH